ncbi:hypothetical protein ACLOJK_021064 [Asimina triloba]
MVLHSLRLRRQPWLPPATFTKGVDDLVFCTTHHDHDIGPTPFACIASHDDEFIRRACLVLAIARFHLPPTSPASNDPPHIDSNVGRRQQPTLMPDACIDDEYLPYK